MKGKKEGNQRVYCIFCGKEIEKPIRKGGKDPLYCRNNQKCKNDFNYQKKKEEVFIFKKFKEVLKESGYKIIKGEKRIG